METRLGCLTLMYSALRHVGAVFRKRRPLQLTFFVTRRCNARCPFCFYLADKDRPADDAEELSLAEIERVAASMDDLLWLAFSGGEPFLRKDLVAISEIFYRHTRPVVMLFPTNGLTPRTIHRQVEAILRRCPKSIIAVKISIDGLHEQHDALRDCPGAFAKAMETYHLLRELAGRHPNLELGINTVFNAANQGAMDAIIDYVRELPELRAHTISMVRGELAHEEYKRVDRVGYEEAAARLERDLRTRRSGTYHFRGGRLKAAQDILQRRLIARALQKREHPIACYAGILNLVLSENGEVHPCESRNESFGNVRDFGYDMGRVTGTEAAQAVRRSIAGRECWCTHECYFITNILFNPALYPRLLRHYLRLWCPAPTRDDRANGAGAGAGRGRSTARAGS